MNEEKPIGVSDRQIEIVQLAADGYVFSEIAEELGIAKNTVESHMHRLYKDTGIKNVQQAVAHFMRYKLIN